MLKDEACEKSLRRESLCLFPEEPEFDFTSAEVDGDQDVAIVVAVEVDAIFLPRQ